MTVNELREITVTFGLCHAKFCVRQYESQEGSDAAEPLWFELDRLMLAAIDRQPDFGDFPDFNDD